MKNLLFTKKYCIPLDFFALSGLPTNPFIVTISVFSSIGTKFSLLFLPNTSVILFLRFPAFRLYTSLPLCVSTKLVSKCAKHMRSNSFLICVNSALSDFRNVLLAGTLKKIFFTSILVPCSQIHSSFLIGVPPFISMSVPMSF